MNNIIELSARRAARALPPENLVEVDMIPRYRPREPQTEPAKNAKLREERRNRWWEASAVREYWKARLQLAGAISSVQRHDLPEGDNHPQYSPDERFAILRTYREALVKQLLTPAPDVASITWKRAALASDQHRHIGVKTEKIERAIAQDLEFLAAHPTRRKIVREERKS